MKIIKSDKLNKIIFDLDYDHVTKSADSHLTMDQTPYDCFEVGSKLTQKAIETNCNIYQANHYLCEIYILAKSEEEAIGRFIIDE